MAKKGSMPTFATVDDYINHQAPEAQSILRELRRLITTAVPEAIELPDYKVPSFTLVPGTKPAQQIMPMASKKAVSFYPFQATVEHFKEELGDYALGRGTVKFALGEPLPEELLLRMVVFRRDEVLGG